MKLRTSRLNFSLIAFSAVILALVLVYVLVVIRQKAKDERSRIQTWATATQRQADLAQRVRVLYANMETEERQYALVWSFVYERVFEPTPSTVKEFDQLRLILLKNNRPFILVDKSDRIIESHDPAVDATRQNVFDSALKAQYNAYPPILIDGQGLMYKIYFKPSDVFFNIRDIFTALENSFSEESLQVVSDITVPVMITDSRREVVLAYANMDENDFYIKRSVQNRLRRMQRENRPIEMIQSGTVGETFYVYYESSSMLRSLRYIAWVLLSTLLLEILGLLSLMRFARRMEQNELWWGMSKETAHQLGTPVSSLLAWIDYYKIKDDRLMAPEDLREIEKDVRRIELVTNRFSKIGSVPELDWDNMVPVIYKVTGYLKGRSSSRIRYEINKGAEDVVMAQINAPLMEWVMENLCKNALNAIGDRDGKITIRIEENAEHVTIDVEDTGKGMTPLMAARIFDPGFTTKTRGWGVGLTFCKRIVEDYHGGQIFVKTSVLNQGTTFRIVLNKKVKRR